MEVLVEQLISDLHTAIEGLYSTFARYPFPSMTEGCPCCVSDDDKTQLHKNTLRELTEDDLSRYTFKAMTTWGDVDDFKYYLPRIFELMSTTDFIVDTFVVLGKLDYGNWNSWPPEEQEAIRQFLLAWWKNSSRHTKNFDKEAFVGIAKLLKDTGLLTSNWTVTFNDQSFENLIDLIENHAYDLINPSGDLRDLGKEAVHQFQFWLHQQRQVLEEGFFHYEKLKHEFAQRISNALYSIERTT